MVQPTSVATLSIRLCEKVVGNYYTVSESSNPVKSSQKYMLNVYSSTSKVLVPIC
jgi:hypothetical protein